MSSVCKHGNYVGDGEACGICARSTETTAADTHYALIQTINEKNIEIAELKSRLAAIQMSDREKLQDLMIQLHLDVATRQALSLLYDNEHVEPVGAEELTDELANLKCSIAFDEGMRSASKYAKTCPYCGDYPLTTSDGACDECGEPHK